MTGRAQLATALSGGECVAFAPLAWSRLAGFVRTTAPVEFWRDSSTTQRMLGDAASICQADAVTVPLLPRLRSSHGPAASCGDIASLEEVAAAAMVMGRLSAIGEIGLTAELPPLAEMARLFPGEAGEDLEDALNDLVRVAVESGAQAVVLRASTVGDLARTFDAIAPLATYYGASVLGIEGGHAAAFHDRCQVGLLERDGRWPEMGRGVVLSGGDLTEWWTPDDLRAVLSGRDESR